MSTGVIYSTEPTQGAAGALNQGWEWLTTAASDVSKIYGGFVNSDIERTLAKAQLAEARAKAIPPNVAGTTPPALSKDAKTALFVIAGALVFTGSIILFKRR
jgi:hypothetical protein